jgi:hypothetical protein
MTWYFLYGIDGYDVNINNNCEYDDNLYLRVILNIEFFFQLIDFDSRVNTVTPNCKFRPRHSSGG